MNKAFCFAAAAVTAALLGKPSSGQVPAPHPPIAVPFTLVKPGYVTLVIEDAKGRRVRNLISETRYPAGKNVAYWDGLDDLGRNPDAAAHGVYDVPGKLSPAGTYHVRGLVRPSIIVRYEAMPYTHGNPGWDTARHDSGWLANHTPPQAALFIPEKDSRLGPGGDTPGGKVLVGSYVAEGGSGLAWLDLAGRKRYGQCWVGGVWTGAPYLARDGGDSPESGVYAYTASLWEDELRLHALVTAANKAAGPGDTRMGGGDDKPVLRPSWKIPGGVVFTERSPLPGMRGIAAFNGLLAVSLPALHQILFVDAIGHQALGVVALPDPRGVAFDLQGHLLALSGASLLRFTLPSGLHASQALDTRAWTATASLNAANASKPFGTDPGARWSTNSFQTPGQWYALDLGRRQTVSSLILTAEPPRDSPVSYEVSTSEDGAAWSAPIVRGEGQPGVTTITLPHVRTRYLKITQLGISKDAYWSINTLQAYNGPSKAEIAALLDSGSDLGMPLDRAGWTAVASRTADGASPQNALGIHGDARWSTDTAQTPGQFFQVDMGSIRTFTSLVLTTPSYNEWPRGFQVFVSQDGRHWGEPVAAGAGRQVGTDTARAGLAAAIFPRVTARYLKIVLTDSDPQKKWVINTLQVYSSTARTLPDGQTLVRAGLQDPQGITVDSAGRIYVSDAGNSHQVKVFSPAGHLVRAIGHAGAPREGTYDPMHMNNPVGLTLDGRGRLWVAEKNFQPKRISVWNPDTGALVNAFYGSYKYGGGGVLDPVDKTLFHIDGMTLKTDEKTGATRPITVYYRQGAAAVPTTGGDDVDNTPMTPLYAHGHQYLTNCYTTSPTNGAGAAILWQKQPSGIAKAVAACGRANDWNILKTAPFRSRWPQGTDPGADCTAKNAALFVWNDLNSDGWIQPGEVVMRRADTGSVTIAPDLSFVVERVDPHPSPEGISPDSRALRYAPTSFTATGAPRYSIDSSQTLSSGAQREESTGMGQALLGTNGWVVLTTAPQPYPTSAVGGSYHGEPLWQYPSLWPGLHPSHNAPMPDRPGELIGTTRLLGGMVTPRGSDAGPLWAINGNKGNVYFFTQDGLFVATLFQDSRTKGWDAPAAVPGMDVSGYSLQEESFYPTLTQNTSGQITLQGNGCILSTTGFEGIRRLPDTLLYVTPSQLAATQAYFVQREAARQSTQSAGTGPLSVALRPSAPVVDGKLEDWAGATWAAIDRRTQLQGDWGHAVQQVEAALAVSGDRLYAAFKTGDVGLLQNRPEALQNLFKSGGALDLQLGAIPGGERLLVTQSGGKTVAVLYRPHVPGTTTDPVKFVSQIGVNKTTLIDRVDDVSSQVQLAGVDGNYELSVPLSLLGLSPRSGLTIQGDVGLLRGNGYQTLQRVYWHNKATGLVSDLASEAELTPELWGPWVFK